MKKKYPTRVTVNITKGGWTIRAFSGAKILLEWTATRGAYGSYSHKTPSLSELPIFIGEDLSDINPAHIAMALEEFYLGDHEDQKQDQHL